jgi:hypothetical protein
MTNDVISTGATALWKATGTTLKTLAVAPLHAGALMVLTTTHPTGNFTAVSGGGCNASGSGLDGAWQLIAGPFANATSAFLEMWMGKVQTTGSSTITVTASYTGTTRLNCKEFFTAGGIDTKWSQDGAGGSKTNTAVTTVTYPTLTPSAPNRLYVGFGTNGTGQTTGATSGYTVELDPGTNPYLYDPDVPQSAQSPISTQASSGAIASYTIGALIKADNPIGSFLPLFM